MYCGHTIITLLSSHSRLTTCGHEMLSRCLRLLEVASADWENYGREGGLVVM